ncbi:hypothetical protein [Priestia megaterium]|uniref:hypothetical protein n=1 Tax=Priestia megaterium TaxID=1404 RepID=UPI000BF5A478|nr:hypothetical protein [Priestia megaterium]MDP9580160.1 hypothetical protein [Bacillus sp. 1751]PFK46822.1 hypothetical protein COJ23_22070 [Priestia megaterium]
MALFDERILEKEKPILKEKKTSNSLLFDEKELDKQIARTKKKNPFSLLQLPKAEKKEKLPEVKKSVADIIPIIDQTDSGLFQLKDDGGFFGIWQLQSTDINAMHDQEAGRNIYTLAKTYQGDKDPFKIISLNLPVSTQKQQQYLEKKIREANNALSLRFLRKKLKELQYLEWGRTNREYFLFLYGPTELAVKERKDQFMRDIQLAIPLLPVSDEKQINLLYKLYNQNAKLGNKQ